MSEDTMAVAASEASEGPRVVLIDDPITVGALAEAVGRSPIDLLRILMKFGVMAPITQAIDFETASIVCAELDIQIGLRSEHAEEPATAEPVEEPPEEEAATDAAAPAAARRSLIRDVIEAEAPQALRPRPLVVTVLGHVDHGKTTLLDTIRQANVVESEAGGITQATGAYQVRHETDGQIQIITFIDTPGHEAFTQMRARGAEVTDLAILVVAADDGVMPQTEEAIDHAQAAEVPILVALNKIDRPNANLNRVLTQLSNQGLTPTDWEGDTQVVPISALTGENIDDLLDTITLLTDELAPRANPRGRTVGTVLEAHVDRKQGVTTMLLVQNGALRKGDYVATGNAWGRIKSMKAFDGALLREAGPGTPVQVLGLSEPPVAGEFFACHATKKQAEQQAKAHRQKDSGADQATAAEPEDFFAFDQLQEEKELRLIVRADVQGSLEPVLSSLRGIKQDEIKIQVLRHAVGDVSLNDVLLAEASQAMIVGFNVGAERTVEERAQAEGIRIRLYRIIYDLVEDIEKLLSGMLDPVYAEIVIGQAEVRQSFLVKGGRAAGCVVVDGVVKNNAQARLVRPGRQERLTRITELRRYRDRVDTVNMGQECGIRLLDIDDFADGDLIEVLELQEQARQL